MTDGTTKKITPFLWFDGKAEEAANFYVSIFKNSTSRVSPAAATAGRDRRGRL
jgi:predicted 3-demethylubiquinone-9 3-methyltransferase (glyoxalase superfamily)